MQYAYFNKAMGTKIIVPCKLSGKDWEPVENEQKQEEKSKSARKKTTTKKQGD